MSNQQIIFALAKSGTKQAKKKLTRYSLSENSEIAELSIFALGECLISEEPMLVIPFLEHQNEDVRNAAIFAVGWNQGQNLNNYIQNYVPKVDKIYQQSIQKIKIMVGDET